MATSDFEFLGAQPEWRDFAHKRTAPILSHGINFDCGIRDMLKAAYTAGFVDCYSTMTERAGAKRKPT